jgi:hypothetical protein
MKEANPATAIEKTLNPNFNTPLLRPRRGSSSVSTVLSLASESKSVFGFSQISSVVLVGVVVPEVSYIDDDDEVSLYCSSCCLLSSNSVNGSCAKPCL